MYAQMNICNISLHKSTFKDFLLRLLAVDLIIEHLGPIKRLLRTADLGQIFELL